MWEGKRRVEELEANVTALAARLDEQAEAARAQQQRHQERLMAMVAESVGELLGPALKQIKDFEEQVGVLEMELNEIRVDHNAVREAVAQQVETLATLIHNFKQAMVPFTVTEVDDIGSAFKTPPPTMEQTAALGNRSARRQINRQQRRG